MEDSHCSKNTFVCYNIYIFLDWLVQISENGYYLYMKKLSEQCHCENISKIKLLKIKIEKNETRWTYKCIRVNLS